MELQHAKQWMNDWMKLNDEQQRNVVSKCQASGVSLNPSAITKLFSESPQLKQYQAHFCDSIILDIAKTIFGVTPENVEHNLRESVFNAICERFNGITINDIGLAFKTHVQQEKVYVLTRDEFIKPIQNYWNKKMIVKREMDSQLQLLQNERQKVVDAENFKREAMQLYVTDLEQGNKKYSGTAFQANSFARAFADLFDDNQKKDMWIEAQREYKELNYQYQENANAFTQPPPPAEKLYALRMVNAALNRGINGYLIIEE